MSRENVQFSEFFLNRSTSGLLWAWRVLRAVDDNHPVALLAVVDTSLAKTVVLDPPLAVDEHAHFEPPLFAHFRHNLPLLKSV